MIVNRNSVLEAGWPGMTVDVFEAPILVATVQFACREGVSGLDLGYPFQRFGTCIVGGCIHCEWVDGNPNPYELMDTRFALVQVMTRWPWYEKRHVLDYRATGIDSSLPTTSFSPLLCCRRRSSNLCITSLMTKSCRPSVSRIFTRQLLEICCSPLPCWTAERLSIALRVHLGRDREGLCSYVTT